MNVSVVSIAAADPALDRAIALTRAFLAANGSTGVADALNLMEGIYGAARGTTEASATAVAAIAMTRQMAAPSGMDARATLDFFVGAYAMASQAGVAPVQNTPAPVAASALPVAPVAAPGVVPAATKARVNGRMEPVVPVRESITPDGQNIICLLDGKPMTMLKRYIMRVYNMTPEDYRNAFGLPDNYPMTAPAYSMRKRDEALTVGLGTHANKAGNNLHRAREAAYA